MPSAMIKLLEVDLTTQTSRVIDVTEETKLYLGGSGLGSKLLWDMVPQGVDPYSPENIIHIGVGPTTGLVGCKTSISFKSPLTGWNGEATVSGYIGDEIMRANYNAGIVIRGKASRPSYLMVYNDKIEIRDASDLWGQYLMKTESTLRRRLYQETGQEFATLSIGPAGENLVRFASAVNEFKHCAAKNGVGAVFGSKNLKAVAVKGTKTLPYADHKRVWELRKTYAMHPVTALQTNEWNLLGANGGQRALLNHNADVFKNGHISWDPVANKSDFLAHELSYRVWADGCPGCATPCFQLYFKNTDHGAFAGELRHGNTAGLCGNAMMGFDDVEEINTLLEELGVDAEDMHGHIAWAMDLYEHGIITKSDLDGIDLKWGDKETAMALLKKIVYREGKAPAALAEGYRHAIEVFGPESRPLAWYSPGNTSIPRYDPRHKAWGLAIPYGTGHGGGTFFDAATMCIFSSFPFYAIFGPLPEFACTFVNAATGWELTPPQMGEIMQRIAYISRCYSLREGYHPDRDAWLPERAFTEPVTNKYGETWVWGKDEWEKAKKASFTGSMKLSERGLPLKDHIYRLGLDYVIAALAPLDALG